MADIFISFRTDDTRRVQAVYDAFRARGLTVFWSNDIPKGAPNYQTIIKEEILKAPIVVVVWTSASVHSGPVVQECSQAERANKLFQILLDDIEPIDMPMEVKYKSQKTMLLGWTGNREHREWVKLNEAVDARLGRKPGAIGVDVGPRQTIVRRYFLPGAGKAEWFKDVDFGPEMVVVPSGTFVMGSFDRKEVRLDRGLPQHAVKIPEAFSVGRHAVTRGEFAAFINKTGYRPDRGPIVGAMCLTDPLGSWSQEYDASWRNPRFKQTDRHPVVCVSWEDAQAYVSWLSAQTQQRYRLPTEAEWEYVARAGTTTRFWWGSTITSKQAQYCSATVHDDRRIEGDWAWETARVDAFAPNAWGLYQVHGNVDEWCEDIWHADYTGAPTDGSAWVHGGDPAQRVIRGGSWAHDYLDAAQRYFCQASVRFDCIGFRVARSLGG